MVNGFPGTADWADLESELDAWGGSGRVATLWWRDDDAVQATPALARLLALADGVPLALAIIPGRLGERAVPELARLIDASERVSVLQHGWMHINHAAPGDKKAEFGADRPIGLMLTELTTGWRRLVDRFGRRALPVLTPPWNRIAATLAPLLRETGYVGLSAAGPRRRAVSGPGLRKVASIVPQLRHPLDFPPPHAGPSTNAQEGRVGDCAAADPRSMSEIIAEPQLPPPPSSPASGGGGYLGYRLSGSTPRDVAVKSDLVEIDTHVDLVAWSAGRGFVGEPTALGRLVGHLRARRIGEVESIEVNPGEPTGLLTHHLIQDAATDAFLKRLLALTRRHPAARWVAAPEAFAAP
jgi:hypothetical protein